MKIVLNRVTEYVYRIGCFGAGYKAARFVLMYYSTRKKNK